MRELRPNTYFPRPLRVHFFGSTAQCHANLTHSQGRRCLTSSLFSCSPTRVTVRVMRLEVGRPSPFTNCSELVPGCSSLDTKYLHRYLLPGFPKPRHPSVWSGRRKTGGRGYPSVRSSPERLGGRKAVYDSDSSLYASQGAQVVTWSTTSTLSGRTYQVNDVFHLWSFVY